MAKDWLWTDRYRHVRNLVLPTAEKVTIYTLFGFACASCTFCWPGVEALMAGTGLKRRSQGLALKRLIARGLIRDHDYRRGGRNRTTQYFVLPALVPSRSDTPCPGCLERMKKSARERVKKDTESSSRDDETITLGTDSPRNRARGARFNQLPDTPEASSEENRAPRARFAQDHDKLDTKPRTKSTETAHERGSKPRIKCAPEVSSKYPEKYRADSATPHFRNHPKNPTQLSAEAERQRLALQAAHPELDLAKPTALSGGRADSAPDEPGTASLAIPDHHTTTEAAKKENDPTEP